MNAAAKTLDAMRANPRDWQVGNLCTVAKQYGITWRQKGTSHCVFVWSDGRSLPVPANRPVKPVYVRMFVKMLEEGQ
ncbi:MAG: hypothetical protein FWG52_08000 [Proteobacteria bacterium]|jgi:hypothetical protein|nr:hypothetical protein [Pseudomonadota bacterium]